MFHLGLPANKLSGRNKCKVEDALTKSMKTLSKSIGRIIKIGKLYKTESYQDLIYDTLTEFVCGELGDEHSRQAYTYAEIFGFSLMVRKTNSTFSCTLTRHYITPDQPLFQPSEYPISAVTVRDNQFFYQSHFFSVIDITE